MWSRILHMESWVHETEMMGRKVCYSDSEIIELDEVSRVVSELRSWTDAFALASWVEAEAETLSYGAVMEGVFDQKGQSDPRILLCVLAYSYALGIFSSEEIVRNCRTKDAFRALSTGKFLIRQELKWFRCRNRPLLTELVGRVFVRAICEWYGLGRTDVAPYINTHLRRLAIERLDIARHLDSIDE
jgi:hypothetical protein